MSKTQHLAARHLIDPNKIMKLPPDMLLLLRVGEYPLITRKLRYCADMEFAGLFDQPGATAGSAKFSDVPHPIGPRRKRMIYQFEKLYAKVA